MCFVCMFEFIVSGKNQEILPENPGFLTTWVTFQWEGHGGRLQAAPA